MTIIGEGMRFVDRQSVGGYDYTQATLTADAAFHDLDLSGIIPKGTKAVYIKITLLDNLVDQGLRLRRKDDVTSSNFILVNTVIANQASHYYVICFCDSAQRIEYKLDNTVWAAISFKILGWFK